VNIFIERFLITRWQLKEISNGLNLQLISCTIVSRQTDRQTGRQESQHLRLSQILFTGMECIWMQNVQKNAIQGVGLQMELQLRKKHLDIIL